MADTSFKNYDAALRDLARELRKNPTPQERKLWYDFLKDYPVRFNRQRIIDGYIADFYSHNARLVVELDGSQHYLEEGMKYDFMRTELMESYDLQVLRFTNREVDQFFDGVCRKIDCAVHERIAESALAEHPDA